MTVTYYRLTSLLTERFQESDVPLNYMSIVCNLTFLKVPVLVQDAQWENYEDQVIDTSFQNKLNRLAHFRFQVDG